MKSRSKKFYMALGSKICNLRKAANISQDELAKVISLTRVSIANIESGSASTTLENIYLLANYFNVTPNDIFPTPKEVANYKPIDLLAKRKASLESQIKKLQEKINSLN